MSRTPLGGERGGVTGHEPVLCEESIEWLLGDGDGPVSRTGATFVDATFGRGGHSRALAARLGGDDRLVVLDRDAEAVRAAQDMVQTLEATGARVSVYKSRFSELGRVLEQAGVLQVQGVIMDLGVSSPQLDDPRRGFSFRAPGPIDMRMDPDEGEPVGAWLNRAAETELVRVIREYGEERYARRIAAAIVRARPLNDTRTLAEVVRGAIPGGNRGPARAGGQRSGSGRGRSPAGAAAAGSDPATRTFQALRIFINNEIEEIEAGIRAAFGVLAPGGRLAVISFHSLEDRIVKRTFRSLQSERELPRRLPVPTVDANPSARIIAGPIRPGAAERARNPRARSATLRVLERLA